MFYSRLLNYVSTNCPSLRLFPLNGSDRKRRKTGFAKLLHKFINITLIYCFPTESSLVSVIPANGS